MPDILAKARTFAVLNATAEGLESLASQGQNVIKSTRAAESASPAP
jgi:hypothetical protein